MLGLDTRTNTYGLSGKKLRVAVTLTAVTGFSLFGYDQGLMSGIITGTQFNEEFPPTHGKDRHATVVQGAVTACYEIGCFFGALYALFSGDKTGRRPIVIIGSILMIIGTVISTAAFGPQWGMGQFVVGRVISGIGNGMNTATIPVWQSEMSKAENRGLLVSFEGSVIAVGTFIAYWIDFGFSYIDSSVQWRFPVAFQIVFAAILLIGMIGLPESPRWLIGKDRIDEAQHVLHALGGDEADKEFIDKELRIIRDSIQRNSGQGGYTELFSGGQSQHFRRMLIGASTQFFQQFTGCNAAIYYSTVLFEDSLKRDHRFSLILGGVFATIYALATIPAFWLVEKVGRRKLFLIGSIGQGCSFVITLACLAASENAAEPQSEEIAKGAAVGLYFFIVFFAFTILQLPWIYPPEINPTRTRTAATSVSTCTNWICNFAVVMFTPVFIGEAGWGAYLFFALMNFIWVPIIFFFYPETAGRSLEEIDIIFAKAYNEKKPVYRVAEHMPKLDANQVEEEAQQNGLFGEKDLATEKNSNPQIESSPSGSEDNA